MKFSVILLCALVLTACDPAPDTEGSGTMTRSAQPNIVFIYLDDLGYGDVGAYGATALATPHMDALAAGGRRFTNGYAASATCTPSRYALLTGVYPWRNREARILPGTAPLIIDTNRLTVPRMLQRNGYHTGVVGKWHLGLGTGNVNWNTLVSPGPNEVGFDYSYIMAATQDRVPTVYLENGQVVGLDPADPIEVDYENNFPGEPTGKDNPELTTMKWHHGHNNSIVNGIPRIGFMKGGQAARWSDIDMADHFLERAQAYVRAHREEPFFLYYALQQPHVPRTPHPRFVGKSGMGPRGDVIVEADWAIGAFIGTLREEGLLENTLIVLSSDNGPVLNDGYYDQAVELVGDHQPAGPLRGGKYSLYEAGTRVPFITYWEGRIAPGVSDALVSQLDLLPSLAALVGAGAVSDTIDGQNLLSTFLGTDSGQGNQGRDHLVLEATSRTALRSGSWLMIPPYPGPAVQSQVNIELGNAPEYQLYDLSEDIGQQRNLAAEHPEKLREMVQTYHQIRGVEAVETELLRLE
ncbi:sulfatase family protein [Neolewinella litorea]|uniref:Arylsulfatase n=1 Tax=Neolewinella litorea TaxID=2562452 RepID=A0A4S4NEL4_9BACT|nr:arylsulfatase [Neolewinella litorea]THH36558.1 arylsulfatase [Neolewinella litorea]